MSGGNASSRKSSPRPWWSPFAPTRFSFKGGCHLSGPDTPCQIEIAFERLLLLGVAAGVFSLSVAIRTGLTFCEFSPTKFVGRS